MNKTTFLAEKTKTIYATQTGNIKPSAVITGMRLDDGSYHVLSRFSDNIWVLPDSLFAAGMREGGKRLKFSRVPLAFQERIKSLIAQYILVGIEGRRRPRGSTIKRLFSDIIAFLEWLQDQRIDRFSMVTPLVCQQYVDFCKGTKSQTGRPLTSVGLMRRFLAVETLHILSSQSVDSMQHPWPESSAGHLAGQTGQDSSKRQEAKTEIIPDAILAPLFRSSVEWLNRADEIININNKIEGWTAQRRSQKFINQRLKALNWMQGEARKALYNLQNACICIILITSGIRASELCSLENHCTYTTEDDQGELFYWMRGVSYKTAKGECVWLVTDITHKAVAVAERCIKPIQVKLAERISNLRMDNLKDPDIVRFSIHTNRLFLGVTRPQNNRIGTLSNRTIIDRLNAFGTQCKLNWHFTPHQFRRTFAVYAAHSAFGDLRYLRDHFKHWSLDMTILYARNQKQDAELYDDIGLEALRIKMDLLEHWLEPDSLITGGAADPIRAFRTNEVLTTKVNRSEMAKTISPLVHLRATGVAWCTADTGGCNGGQGVERTRCSDCSNAVIDLSRKPIWKGIYAQQLKLRTISDIGPGGAARIERDIERCMQILKDLGATEEELTNVAT